MDDDEVLDALRTALDATDPPPTSLRAKAIAARTWDASGTTEAQPRPDADLVGAGMRSTDDAADGAESSRDLAYEAAGHTIDVTIVFADNGETNAELIVIVRPGVDTVTVVSPFDAPVVVGLDPGGRAALTIETRAIALEFTAGSGARVRTPLIRLF